MPDTDKTEAALTSLQNAEFVTEFTEGSNSAKRLTPSEMLQMLKLEREIAAEDRRRTNGIYRRVT